MAGLTVGLTLVGLSAVGASLYNITNSTKPDGDSIFLSDRTKIEAGSIVKLRQSAISKYPEKGLTKPGSTFTGTVQYIDRETNPVMIHVTNIVRNRRFADSYDPNDFTLIQASSRENIGGVKIRNGFANVGTQVRYQKVEGSENSSPKSLGNPFYNSVGTVESIDLSTKKITVKATGVKNVNITYTQEYDANELIFVSLPHDDDVRGVPSTYGFINVGSRVSLKIEKYMEYQKDSVTSITRKLASSERFLANKSFDKVGVVQALLFDKDGKHRAVVKCKHIDSTHYYDQEYAVEDLQVIGSDGVPAGTVFILGGIAESGVKVKLREETKELSAGKCLSRTTYGFKGIVEDIDPNSEDNLKVQVRCVGENNGEEASDWYEPEHLEILDMPTDQGIPIFGGIAAVGELVEVMIDALGKKCLGKPSIGNVGVVVGIDPNASGGETLNIKCGRDNATNSKVSNWYKPTDVKVYVKIDMTGSILEQKEAELILERAKLVKVQRRVANTPTEKDAKQIEIDAITRRIKELTDEIEGEKKKGTTLEGMRDLYNKLMEELVKFRRSTAAIDEEYNTARLDTTCNISDISTESEIRRESEGIIDKYYAITDDVSVQAITTPRLPTQPYISDAPSANPIILERLETEAAEAIQRSADSPGDAALKTAATTAADALVAFKKSKKTQAPRTDLQKAYIKKRDVLIEALRVIVPDAGPGAGLNQLIRTDIITSLAVTVPAQKVLNRVAVPDKFNAYLMLVEKVEEAKLTNPADPIAYLASLGAPNVVIGAAELNAFIDDGSSQGAYTPTGGATQTEAQKFLQAKAQQVTIANNALNPPAGITGATGAALANPILTLAKDIAVSKCKLAAFDVLVESVDNSNNQTPSDRFLTKLYWEKKYKEYSRKEFSGNPQRSFDMMDVILRKLNESVKKFQESIQNPGPFKDLSIAFGEFNSARESVYTEVHGETTLLEQQINRMVIVKRKQDIQVNELNRAMLIAQQEYVDAVKAEKDIEFYVTNALKSQTEETSLYLTKSEGKSDKQPQPQQGQQQEGKRQKRRQRGGALSSKKREVNDYISRILTNFMRIQHYRTIIKSQQNLAISNTLVSDQNLPKLVSLVASFRISLLNSFKASRDNNNLYTLTPIGTRLATPTITLQDSGLARRQAELQRRQKDVQQKITAASTAATTQKNAAQARIQMAQNFAAAVAATYDAAAKQTAQIALNKLKEQRGGANTKATNEYIKLVQAVETARASNPRPADVIGEVAGATSPPVGIAELNAAGPTSEEKLAAYGALVQAVEASKKIHPNNPISEAVITNEQSQIANQTVAKVDKTVLNEVNIQLNNMLRDMVGIMRSSATSFVRQTFNVVERNLGQDVITRMRNLLLVSQKLKTILDLNVLPKNMNDIIDHIIASYDIYSKNIINLWTVKVFKTFKFIIEVLFPKYPDNIKQTDVNTLQNSTIKTIKDKFIACVTNPTKLVKSTGYPNREINTLSEDPNINVADTMILDIFPSQTLPDAYLVNDYSILEKDAISFSKLGVYVDILIKEFEQSSIDVQDLITRSNEIKELNIAYEENREKFRKDNLPTVDNFKRILGEHLDETTVNVQASTKFSADNKAGANEFNGIIGINIHTPAFNSGYTSIREIKEYIATKVDDELNVYSTPAAPAPAPSADKIEGATIIANAYKNKAALTFFDKRIIAARKLGPRISNLFKRTPPPGTTGATGAAAAAAAAASAGITGATGAAAAPPALPPAPGTTSATGAVAAPPALPPAPGTTGATGAAPAPAPPPAPGTTGTTGAAPPPTGAAPLPPAVIAADTTYQTLRTQYNAASGRNKGLLQKALNQARGAANAARDANGLNRLAGGRRKTARYPMASRRKTQRV